MLGSHAAGVIRHCRTIAGMSEEAGCTTRTFLCAPMRDVHAYFTDWMTRAGMDVRVDAAGNLRGAYRAAAADAPTFFIGSHLDTVPHAGAFDGVLGVVLAIALVNALGGERLPFAIEVIGFSEEEGVRFGVPFIGSRALAGTLDDAVLNRCDVSGRSVRDAIRDYGLDPSRVLEARADRALGYLEFHIEQGPVLERLHLPLGVVHAIVGQTRIEVLFTGMSGHAGTVPMDARRDALAAAAEFAGVVEREACGTPGLVATVGRIDAEPGSANVIAGRARALVDVRHADDRDRVEAVAKLARCARAIATRRNVDVSWMPYLEQPAVTMDPTLTALLERAVERCGTQPHRLASGAGHDAMIVAARMPAAMLFLRSPGGISHHPDEDVRVEDVELALTAGRHFLDELSRSRL